MYFSIFRDLFRYTNNILNTKLNTKQLKLTIIVLDLQLILRIPRIGRVGRFLYIFRGLGLWLWISSQVYECLLPILYIVLFLSY
uniref:AtpE n=1 Tax=Dysphania botrys TaxID=240045 RepID=A0A482FF37_DYSBO